MLILVLIIMLSISYAMAFRSDFPDVLLTRTLIILGIILILLNLKEIIKFVIYLSTNF